MKNILWLLCLICAYTLLVFAQNSNNNFAPENDNDSFTHINDYLTNRNRNNFPIRYIPDDSTRLSRGLLVFKNGKSILRNEGEGASISFNGKLAIKIVKAKPEDKETDLFIYNEYGNEINHFKVAPYRAAKIANNGRVVVYGTDPNSHRNSGRVNFCLYDQKGELSYTIDLAEDINSKVVPSSWSIYVADFLQNDWFVFFVHLQDKTGYEGYRKNKGALLLVFDEKYNLILEKRFEPDKKWLHGSINSIEVDTHQKLICFEHIINDWQKDKTHTETISLNYNNPKNTKK